MYFRSGRWIEREEEIRSLLRWNAETLKSDASVPWPERERERENSRKERGARRRSNPETTSSWGRIKGLENRAAVLTARVWNGKIVENAEVSSNTRARQARQKGRKWEKEKRKEREENRENDWEKVARFAAVPCSERLRPLICFLSGRKSRYRIEFLSPRSLSYIGNRDRQESDTAEKRWEANRSRAAFPYKAISNIRLR